MDWRWPLDPSAGSSHSAPSSPLRAGWEQPVGFVAEEQVCSGHPGHLDDEASAPGHLLAEAMVVLMSLKTNLSGGGCLGYHAIGCLGYAGWGWPLFQALNAKNDSFVVSWHSSFPMFRFRNSALRADGFGERVLKAGSLPGFFPFQKRRLLAGRPQAAAASPECSVAVLLLLRHQPTSFIRLIPVQLAEDNDISMTKRQLLEPWLTRAVLPAVTLGTMTR